MVKPHDTRGYVRLTVVFDMVFAVNILVYQRPVGSVFEGHCNDSSYWHITHDVLPPVRK